MFDPTTAAPARAALTPVLVLPDAHAPRFCPTAGDLADLAALLAERSDARIGAVLLAAGACHLPAALHEDRACALTQIAQVFERCADLAEADAGIRPAVDGAPRIGRWRGAMQWASVVDPSAARAVLAASDAAAALRAALPSGPAADMVRLVAEELGYAGSPAALAGAVGDACRAFARELREIHGRHSREVKRLEAQLEAALPPDGAALLILAPEPRAALFEAVARATEAQAHDELDFGDLDRDALLALRAELAPAWPSPAATTYTVSARKPASSDWCRGCHMADYPAGNRRLEGLTRQQAADELGSIRLTKYGPGEARWSAHAFADGPVEGCEPGELDPGFEAEVQRAVLRQGLERDAREAAKVAEAQAKAAEAKRASDLAQLAALKAQYGGAA